MTWLNILVLFSVLTAGNMINRPVYKIVLTQKGYAQFLQYDIETPPLREFTFCTWIRVYDFGRDQSIFTYVANGSRIARLWLESGGGHIKISMNGKVTSTSTVDIMKDVWRHLCLSYQSDFGAWALYIDARLVSCEAAQSLRGYTLPGGGSVIIGYGTSDNGSQNGFQGEIFGANMILASTIKRNYTAKNDPLHEQKRFTKNKIKNNNRHSYVILSDLQTDEIHNNFENTELPPFLHKENFNKSYIKFRTPYNYIEHDVGIELTPTTSKIESKSKEILDISVTFKTPSTNNYLTNLWSTINEAEYNNQFKSHKNTNKFEPSQSGTIDLPIISEYETPPPPLPLNQKYIAQNFERNEQPSPLSIYKIGDNDRNLARDHPKSKIYTDKIAEVETPPPQQKNTKVYGQWTSSKFAGSVLNYLKSINFHKKEQKKPPPTIPLFKVSDSFPYASEFKLTKIRPPSFFQRKNLIEKRYDITKASPQINIQILQDDLRSNIIKSHAHTRPKLVEILNRGDPMKHEHRFYRNIDNQDTNENIDSVEVTFKPKKVLSLNKNKHSSQVNLTNNDYLFSVLSFLNSNKYSSIIEDSSNTEAKLFENSQDMYSKSFSKGNKWHNVKSYNNDYTPRHINMDSKTEIDKKNPDFNKNIPSIRLNYKNENYKLGRAEDENILKARDLAMKVSNQSNFNTDMISILKYNHGFLPTHEREDKISDKLNQVLSNNLKSRINTKYNFNKHIKIGNALNERLVIGVNDEQKKVSFVGGIETIPDINRYRSELDIEDANVPPSLGPRVCKNVELYDRVLYVQPDESIDMTHILSPIRVKNIGIEFIIQNYKKCSLTESLLEKSDILYINWSKTPVRLFGGAYPRTTTDLCGFF